MDREHLSTSLFVIVSLALHTGLLYLIFARPPLQLGQTYSTRLVLNLQSDLILSNTASTESDDTKIEKAQTAATLEKKEAQPNPVTEPPSAVPSSNQSSVWNVNRVQREKIETRVTEQQNLQLRLGQERVQQQNSVNSNVAQLFGRLQMMQISVSCALRLSNDFKQGSLTCAPSQYEGLIKQGLTSSYIRWSEASDFKAVSCVSITSLNLNQACD